MDRTKKKKNVGEILVGVGKSGGTPDYIVLSHWGGKVEEGEGDGSYLAGQGKEETRGRFTGKARAGKTRQ